MLRTASVATVILLSAGCTSISVTESPYDSRADSRAGAVASADTADFIPAHQRRSDWYRDARAQVLAANAGRGAKNVVLFLGDGMGISTVTAARILAGQLAGQPGEENRLSFEAFPVTGLSKTYNVDSQTADSAGTMSAIMTGVKTNIGVFGIDENVISDDCASGKGHELLSLLDIAELAGKRTGVISTARLTHATPAATYARTANRDWEDDSQMSAAARGAGCEDIALQFVRHSERLNAAFGAGASDGIEVALGGGSRHFLPKAAAGALPTTAAGALPATAPGLRTDGRNLIDEWQRSYPNGRYVSNARELDATSDTPVLGLFSASHMDYALQRDAASGEQPSLVDMTLKALELLERDGNGYLLVVEAGRIDHAHHAGNAANALHDTIELSEAVAALMQRVSDDTLVMVTADHSHVFTMAGYPRRGNPILGKVVPTWSDEPMLDEEGLPYTTLGYMNGRGQRDHGGQLNADSTYAEPPNTGRQDISAVDTTAPGYHQEALIPLNAETHGGEDVAVYARGPGAGAAAGVREQNLLFHVMLNATDWERQAGARISTLQSSER